MPGTHIPEAGCLGKKGETMKENKNEKVIHDIGWWKTHLVECLRCGNMWLPKQELKTPVVCPSCQSPYWDQEKREKKPDVKKESA